MENQERKEEYEALLEATKNAICFDAEPLLAYYWDTAGSDTIEDYFVDILQGKRIGYVSDITYCEVRYHLLRESSERFFHFYDFLSDTIELQTVSSGGTWRKASDIKAKYPIALGDAFSIATAFNTDSTLIIGADDDFDKVTEVDMDQVRTDPD